MRIIVDTREKTPWKFRNSIAQKLDTGDYSVLGYEDDICIERKKSVSEIAQNIVDPRFWREIERMGSIKYRVIICEFSEADVASYPSQLPWFLRKKARIKGKFILSKIREIVEDFNIEVVYCNNHSYAQVYARDWLKVAVKNANTDRK